MPKAFIDGLFDPPEQEEKDSFPATDEDLIAFAEKFSSFEVPYKVFLQAISIAAYDIAAACRYADNYLTTKKNVNKSKNSFHKQREPYFKI
jgi:hypothetical protein